MVAVIYFVADVHLKKARKKSGRVYKLKQNYVIVAV